MTERFAPVCAPHLGVTTTDDLRHATLIHTEVLPFAPQASVPSWPRFAEAAGLGGLDLASGISFNDESSAIQAAIAGQGIALVSLTLVAAELASGMLVQPFGPVMPGLRYRLLAPAGPAVSPAAEVLRQWVLEEFVPEGRTSL